MGSGLGIGKVSRRMETDPQARARSQEVCDVGCLTNVRILTLQVFVSASPSFVPIVPVAQGDCLLLILRILASNLVISSVNFIYIYIPADCIKGQRSEGHLCFFSPRSSSVSSFTRNQ